MWLNCKLIKKVVTPHFYINPPFSGLSPLSSKQFRIPPSDSIFGRSYPPSPTSPPFNKGRVPTTKIYLVRSWILCRIYYATKCKINAHCRGIFRPCQTPKMERLRFWDVWQGFECASAWSFCEFLRLSTKHSTYTEFFLI